MSNDPDYKFRKMRRSRLVPVPREVAVLLPHEQLLLKQAKKVWELPENCGSTLADHQDKEDPRNQKLLTSGIKPTPAYQRCLNCKFWREEEPDGWDVNDTSTVLLCGSFRSDYFNLSISPGHRCREFRTSELHQKLHDQLWEHSGDLSAVVIEEPENDSK